MPGDIVANGYHGTALFFAGFENPAEESHQVEKVLLLDSCGFRSCSKLFTVHFPPIIIATKPLALVLPLAQGGL